MNTNKTWHKVHEKFLSVKTKKSSEKLILIIAIFSFIIHLILTYMVQGGLIKINSNLFNNPIAAIYTPFSFILLYEVYLLIYYIPKSITIYVGKQYEIITLIVIRRLFKDLSNLELSTNWFELKGDMQFTYDITVSILLFYLIYLFKVQSRKRQTGIEDYITEGPNLQVYINFKKIIASSLVPILVLIAGYSFISWFTGALYHSSVSLIPVKNLNNIFFDEFFTILIIIDVILLLLSFFYTDNFHKVIRNSGFVISTILIRLSFGVDGLINTILILSSVVFGLIILFIYNKYEKNKSLWI